MKTIAIYSSWEVAMEAVGRLKTQPGFRDFPCVVNPDVDEKPDGFYLDEYLIDQDCWQEGYETR